MRFYFIVEDAKGPRFVKKLFRKKLDENVFSGSLIDATRVPIRSDKLRRTVSAAVSCADRIIILADADGCPIDEKRGEIIQYVKREHRDRVRVVLLDHEIEEWICYSKGFPINDKPSHVLKHRLRGGYEKNDLSEYAATLDCKKLGECRSFRQLLDAMARGKPG